MRGLRLAFDSEYAEAGFTWSEVKTALPGVFEHLHLYVINGKSDEALDFDGYKKSGIGLTAIAVGGLSLSRGLTIEGLTVSYMYRNTRMYDTLMQMGRWFGYRPGFEDLCRVHLSTDSINWYAHIADAAEELVQQVKRMRRDKLSPEDFGLYVRSHPDSLLITAANKMRHGEEVSFQQSFSGRLVESSVVSTSVDVNQRNFRLIESHWKTSFGGVEPQLTGKGYIFRNVEVTVIEDFLASFDCHSSFSDRKSAALEYLVAIAERHPLGDVLLISPVDSSGATAECPLNFQHRAVGENQPSGTSWRLNKHRVASRGDEKLGLSEAQLAKADAIAREGSGSHSTSDTHYRMVRGKPLLMIHRLRPKADTLTGDFAAFGISFPDGDDSTTISVVANKVWLQQMQGETDDPDDEDDHDA